MRQIVQTSEQSRSESNTTIRRLGSEIMTALAATMLLAVVIVGISGPVEGAEGDAPVTGSFFVDFDRDGTIDTGEAVNADHPHFPPNGLSVTAFGAEEASVDCTTASGESETFSCNVDSLTGSLFRLEFSIHPDDEAAGYTTAFLGADYRGDIVTVAAGGTATFGVIPPSACPSDTSTDGHLWTTCYTNGDRDNAEGPQDVLVNLDFDNSAVTTQGSKSQLGSVYGIAYDEWTNTVFTSATLRRHSELGPAGLGAIYWATHPSTDWTTFDLTTLGGSSFGTIGARDADTGEPFEATYDIEAFAKVTKAGIGDIDVTPDGQTLIVTNLNSRSVMTYDITDVPLGGDPVFISELPITAAMVNCANDSGANNADDFAIFALYPKESDQLYVGATCTAQTSQDVADLEAVMLDVTMDGDGNAVSATDILHIPLDYTRGCANRHSCAFPDDGNQDPDGDFQPWDDDFDLADYPGRIDRGRYKGSRPSPVFSDISAEIDGSLTLNIMDRSGDQLGSGQYMPIEGNTDLYEHNVGGEILKVCNVTGDPDNPSYAVETDTAGVCPGNFVSETSDTTNQNYHGGPGGEIEFYGEDRWSRWHLETSSGGNWVHPKEQEVVVATIDPLDGDSGGLAWFDTINGSETDARTLYSKGTASGYAGKSNGIGDVEGCFIPLQVGSTVWLDLDQDGIQGGDETLLEGVTVSLLGEGGAVVATTTTDANGNYSFSSYDGLEANASYDISFDVSTLTTVLPGDAPASRLAETTADATGETATDDNDSDVVDGTISFTAGGPGTVDHSFDAGYVLPYDLALEHTLESVDTDTRTAVFKTMITNQGLDVENIEVTNYLDAPTENIWEDFDLDANPEGTVDEITFTWNAEDPQNPVVTLDGPLASGESVMVPITVTWVGELPEDAMIDSWAEISNFDDDGIASNGDASTGDIEDADSMPDADQTNDNQPEKVGDPTDGVINEDGKNDGDEDDHDVAGVRIWDLTLINTRAEGQPYVLDLGAKARTIQFDIAVANQGTEGATQIAVTDYLPEGTVYTRGEPPLMPTLTTAGKEVAVRDLGNGSFVIDRLAAGDDVKFGLTVDVVDESLGVYVNGAEISAFLDDDGQVQSDIDSTPDAENTDDHILDPTNADNENNSHNLLDYDPDGDGNLNEATPGDEDDHDCEVVVVGFDQALTVALAEKATTFPVAPGELVTFNVELTNQGRAVELIALTNYVQSGFDFDLEDNALATATDSTGTEFALTWDTTTPDAPVATLSRTGEGEALAPGATVVVPVALRIAPDFSGGALVNWAEISNFDDDLDPTNGDAASGDLEDVDSMPNDDIADDNQPLAAGDPTDDAITEDGKNGGDEDDHDVADVAVLDLALINVINTAESELPVTQGSKVTFTITVTNQGSTPATDISIIDYVDLDMWAPFDPAINAETADFVWSASETDGLAELVNPLAPGESIEIPVMLMVAPTADLTNLVNTAEIASSTAADDEGTPVTYPGGIAIPDIDSTPDAENDDPQPAAPGDPTDNVTANEPDSAGVPDEDDHDIAGVDAPEFSLGNQVWLDENNNGLIDEGETPLEAIWMELFTDDDGDGLADDLDGDGAITDADAVAKTGTDSEGTYLFDALTPGDYIVGIPPMEWEEDGPLYGHLSSDPTSTNPNDDIDGDDNGIVDAENGYVMSGAVTLGDSEPTAESPDNDTETLDSNENLTVDFGFWAPVFDLAIDLEPEAAPADGFDVGDEITWTVTLKNEGDLAAIDVELIDMLPDGLELLDTDWKLGSDGNATFDVNGIVLPNTTTDVEITTRVTGGTSIDNEVGINKAQAADANGVAVLMPNGAGFPDVDSGESPINSSTTPDDVAVSNVSVNQTTPNPIAFTGSNSSGMLGLAAVMLFVGLGLLVLARRDELDRVED